MKDYIIQLSQQYNGLDKLKEGDIIQFEMPPFCSGDYEAVVKRDASGLYIEHDDNYFNGARDINIKKKVKK